MAVSYSNLVVNANTNAPYGLTLQQTITSGTSVTIPAGINWVYAILVGGGGGAGGSQSGGTNWAWGGGGGGGITMGWAATPNGGTQSCTIGAGGAGGIGASN